MACPSGRCRSMRTCARVASPASTTSPAPSGAATAARTRRARRSASPSTARPWRTPPSPCASATPCSSRASARTRSRRTSASASADSAGGAGCCRRETRRRCRWTAGTLCAGPLRAHLTSTANHPRSREPGGRQAKRIMYRLEDEEEGDDSGQKPDEQPVDRNAASLTDAVRDRLFKSRTLIISGEINQRLVAHVMGQLLAMADDSDQPINIFINSQGGHVESGDTIHDVIRFIKPRVRMVGTGWVASAGALIYVSVPREDRYALPNTRFLLHQPAGGAGGTAADVEIEAREIIRMRERLNKIFARETGQPFERIETDTHRNFWLEAEQAREYGLVGQVIKTVDELK